MSITYLPDPSQSNGTSLVMVFKNEDNLTHIDSVTIPYTENGSIDNIELENRIQALYNHQSIILNG